tara:strand:+ start:5743 stop:11913 length:6171 start_codon:yes stop_codon:yes gene_type:complete
MVKPYFFIPPELEEYYSAQSTANKKEVDLFKKQITPELAQQVADVSRAYPTLDKRLVSYLPQMGVQADDELLLDIAAKQFSSQEKQDREKVITDVNPFKRFTQMSDLKLTQGFEWVSRGFKSAAVASQATDTPLLEGVLKSGLSGFALQKNGPDQLRRKLLGDTFADAYNESKEKYGATRYTRAKESQEKYGVRNLGTGFFANSQDLTQTEGYKQALNLGYSPARARNEAAKIYGDSITQDFAKDENQFKYDTKVAGDVNISPGRILAGTFSPEGSVGYSLTSALVDGVFRLGADPTNLLFMYGSGVKAGSRAILSNAERTAYVNKTTKAGRAVKTIMPGKKGKEARRQVFGKTADEILNSRWGKDFITGLTKNDSIAQLNDIPQLRNIDPYVKKLLVGVKDEDVMREVVKSLMRGGDLEGILLAPYSGTYFNAKVMNELINARPLNKLPMQPKALSVLANNLAEALTGGSADIAPLRRTVGALIGKKTNNQFGGVIGLGGQLTGVLPVKLKRAFGLAPTRIASINLMTETADNLDRLMKVSGAGFKERDEIIFQLLKAKNQQEVNGVVNSVFRTMTKSIKDSNPDLVDEDEIFDYITKVFQDESRERMYFYGEKGIPMQFPGTKVNTSSFVDEAGNIIDEVNEAVPTAFSLREMAEHYAVLPDYEDLLRSTQMFRRVVGPKGSRMREAFSKATTWEDAQEILKFAKIPRRGFEKSWRTKGIEQISPEGRLRFIYNDIIQQRALKPMWMLRAALAIRVPGEEHMRMFFKGAPSLINHPYEYHLLNPFMKKMLGRSDNPSISLVNANKEVLYTTRIMKDEISDATQLLGSDEFSDGLSKVTFPEIQQLIKTTNLGVNIEGQVGSRYLKAAFEGNDAKWWEFEDIGELKTLKDDGVINRKTVDEVSNQLGDIVTSGESQGGSVALNNKNKARYEGNVIAYVSPYKPYQRIINDEYLNNQALINNTDRKGALKVILEDYITDPKIKSLLEKENHVFGYWWDDSTKEWFFDISVAVPKITKEGDLALKDTIRQIQNSMIIGIKGHQKSIFIPRDVIDSLGNAVPKELNDLLFEVDEGYLVSLVDDISGKQRTIQDTLTSDVDLYTVINKNVLEYLYEENFTVAKQIIDSKPGTFASTRVTGQNFRHTDEFMKASADQSIIQRLRPGRTRNKIRDDFYDTVTKRDANGNIRPEWWRFFTTRILNFSTDELHIRVARDGVEETLNWVQNSKTGREYIEQIISMSEDYKMRGELLKPGGLEKYVKAAAYRIGQLQGNSTLKIFDDAGNEILNRYSDILKKSDQGEFLFHNYEVDLSQGSRQVLDFIANGGFIDGEDFVEYARKVNINTAKKSFVNKFMPSFKEAFKKDLIDTDLGAQELAGNMNKEYMLDGVNAQNLGEQLDIFLRDAYSLLLTKPSDTLNREPLFKWAYFHLSKEEIAFLNKDARQELGVFANKWLTGSKLNDDIQRQLRETPLDPQESIMTLEDMDLRLKSKSLEFVSDLLYASTTRHVASDLGKTYVPFPEIWAEVPKTWSNLIKDNPQKFYRASLGIDSGKEAKPWDSKNGFFEEDPVTGELMFHWLDVFNVMSMGIPKLLNRKSGLNAAPMQQAFLGDNYQEQGVRVKPEGFVSGLNLVSANGYSPGFGWWVTVPYRLFSRRYGVNPPEFVEEFLLGSFGDRKQRFGILDQVGWARDIIKGSDVARDVLDDPEYDEAFNSTVMDIYTMLYYAGEWTPDDAASQDRAWEQAEQAASNHWFFRGGAKFGLPTGIQPRYELEDKDGRWWQIQALTKSYSDMLVENDYDYYLTTQTFIEKYGINPVPLRERQTARIGNRPVTEDSYRFWSEVKNEKHLNEFPLTGIYHFPDNYDDEFSYEGYLNANVKLKPAVYGDLLNQTLLQLEIKNEKKRIKLANPAIQPDDLTAHMAAFTERKVQEYGVLPFGSLGESVDTADWKQKIVESQQWDNDEFFNQSPTNTPLQEYLKERNRWVRLQQQGGTYKGVTVDPKDVLTGAYLISENKEFGDAIRANLHSFGLELMKKYPYPDYYWSSMYYGVFYREVNNRLYGDK